MRPPQDEVEDWLLQINCKTLMVRSAAKPRVSNHEATECGSDPIPTDRHSP